MSDNNIKDPSKSSRKLGWKEIEIGGIIKGPTSLNNKTGSWKSFKPIHDLDKCIHCMKCVERCPDNSIIGVDNDGRYGDDVKTPYIIDKFDYEYCKGCGLCASVCPVDAIEMKRVNR